jgi:hypothetical protein
MKHAAFVLVLAIMLMNSEAAKYAWESSTTYDTTARFENTYEGGTAAIGARAMGPAGRGIRTSGGWRGIETYGGGEGVWATGGRHGVVGITQNSQTYYPGVGVYGQANAHNIAVMGSIASNLSSGIGVYGEVFDDWPYENSPSTAIKGKASSGKGVWAISTTGIGVLAEGGSYGVMANATSGPGVHSEGYQVGVFGKANHENGAGIQGEGNEGVYGYGNSYYEPTGVWGWADRSSSSSDGSTFGVRGTAVDGNYAYGVYGEASYGYYGNWAGYFDGDVYAVSYSSPSDLKFKKNVSPMTGGLAKVMALKPKTYDMKTEEFKDKIVLPKGKQYGLIAQELETVFPELVNKTVAPARYTKEERKSGAKKAGTEFKSVNYQALIPILVQAIQEQQETIQKQDARIRALEAAR